MKFLIYPASKQSRCKPKNRMTRIYLADGTELKVDSVEIVGREEVCSVTHRPIEQGGPVVDRRFVPDRLILTFKAPAFVTVDKRPKKGAR